MKRLIPIFLLAMTACTTADLEVHQGYVEADGARIYYEEAGEGPPVVMLHGGFLDRRMWDQQFQTFARRYRAIRYDARAHGLSNADSVPFADYEDLRVLLESLDVDSAVVMGLSLGGRTAIDFALVYPEMVSALVLVGPGISGFGFDSEEIREYAQELSAALDGGEFQEIIGTFARYWCDGPYRDSSQVDSVVRANVLDMLGGSEQRWRFSRLAELLDPPATDWVQQLRVPTMAIVGSIDMPDIHLIVDMITERVPGARKIEIPDVAHMVNMEAPREFNDLVLDYLDDLARH